MGPTKLSAAEPAVSLPAVRSDHLPTSGAEQLPATFPHRVAAIWKIVTSGVTTTQSQVRRRASRQEVSSTFAGCVRTYPPTRPSGFPERPRWTAPTLATILVEMDRPTGPGQAAGSDACPAGSRPPGRPARRSRGPNALREHLRQRAQVRVPHCVQVRRCSRYSVTSGWKGGISAT